MTDAVTTTHTRTGDVTIRPFKIDVAQEAVDDMRRRIAATRWPEREMVTDDSQGLADSPVHLAAFAIDHGRHRPARAHWADRGGTSRRRAHPRRHPRQHHALLADQHRGLGGPSLLGEHGPFFDAKDISIPFAISVFPDELYQAPRSWAERAYPNNLMHYKRLDRGGHFAAWEQPRLLSEEMRVAFRSLH